MKKLLLIPLLFVFTTAAVGQDAESLLAAQHRPSANSTGFYIGAFGGGAVLPIDLASTEDKWESPYGNSGWEFQGSLRPKVGYNIGLTLGYDFSEYWGIESRLHIMEMSLDYKWSLTDWRKDGYGNIYYPFGLEGDTVNNWGKRTSTIFDASAHWYPWGNVRWSPYFKAGLGYANQKIKYSYEEEGMTGYKTVSMSTSSDVFAMPLGVGLRYQWSPQVSFRLDLTDNILFKSKLEVAKDGAFDIKTNHNLTLTVGITYSFGGGSFQSARRY